MSRSTDPYATDDGDPVYVLERREWGRMSETLVAAPTLKDAKERFGWTRELHVSLRVRRARVSDVARITDGRPYMTVKR